MWKIVAVILGLLAAGIRLWMIPGQLFGGDEIHSLQAAADQPLVGLFGYHLPAENCIPLSLWARSLLDLGLFDEMTFRLPAIVSGLLLPLVPWLLLRSLGAGACAIASALLAVWPMSLYYSFVGRPYGPAALLLALSLVAWHRWLEGGGRGHLVRFALAATFAAYFHVLCLFPVAWLLGVAWLESRRAAVPRREPWIAGAIVVGATTLLLAPGLRGLIELRLLKEDGAGAGTPVVAFLGFVDLAGGELGNALLLFVAGAAGGVLLLRSAPLLGRGLVGFPLALVVGLLVTQPFPTVQSWSRYQFLTWPAVVMLVAVAGAALLRRVPRLPPLGALGLLAGGAVLAAGWWLSPAGAGVVSRGSWPWLAVPLLLCGGLAGLVGGPARLRCDAALAVCAALLATSVPILSPIAIFAPGRDDFRGRRTSLAAVTSEREAAVGDRVPTFFAELGEPQPGDRAIVLWPFDLHWRSWIPLAADQRAHRRQVFVATEPPMAEKYGVRLRRAAHLDDPRWIAEHGVRYLVVLTGHQRRVVPPATLKSELKRLRGRYGRPVFRDERVVVFDLERASESAAGR